MFNIGYVENFQGSWLDLIDIAFTIICRISIAFHVYLLCKATAITIDDLVNMIKNAKHLEFLALVDVRNIRIDQAVFKYWFKQLLNLVQIEKEELTINISGCKTTTSFNVPENIQKANAKCLVIEYEKNETNQCESITYFIIMNTHTYKKNYIIFVLDIPKFIPQIKKKDIF